MDLDAPQDYASVDPADALGDVEATAAQWREAAESAPAPLDLSGTDVIVLTGMGGSGIAGDVLRATALEGFGHPIVVHKGYGLPGFVNDRTLVVAFSHSGSTEETLSAFADAGARGAQRLVVTSGGALTEQAQADGVPVAAVPPGNRPPRHSLGSLLVPALIALGLDDGLDEAIDVIEQLTGELGRDVPTAQNPAKQLGARIADGVIPLAWGGQGIGSVAAYRLKCQLNENAKLPALHAEIPEGGHNDVVGWETSTPLSGVGAFIALRDTAGEHPRVAQRFDITTELLSEQVAWAARIDARGGSPLARIASLLVQSDLVSLYAALALDCDPTPIRSIDRLKSQLAAAQQ